ncbi:hypothetical protein ET495_09830 [Xylanimonas allomyrinae]|uniref:Uncharacterized protein n=1 Tax=Xylanimonas allomyrinae TaxID=2509459 RepID=A0A4P6EP23_9MICO|nr:hypothetical protein [Xylanimonas allomyrinae]QAY63503.1 hypothetical protein ET495_09830 [Xylanimonas allomyrinae]
MRRDASAARLIASGAGIVLSYAVVPFAILVVIAVLTRSTSDLDGVLALKAVAITASLVAITMATDRRWHPAVLLGLAAAGLAANPSTWAARTYLAQLWVEPGPTAIIIDAIAWLAVVGLVVAVRRRHAARVRARC